MVLFVDIETTGLNPFVDDIALVQVMNEAGKVFLIQDLEALQELKPVLESNVCIGHNIKFDSKFLKHHCNINLNQVYDTYLAELAISGGLLAGRKGANLQTLALKYAGVELDKSEQTGFKPNQTLTADQIKYASQDVQVLRPIYKQQQNQIIINDLQNTIDIENSCIPATVWLELSGAPVDLQRLEVLKQETLMQQQKTKGRILEYLKEGDHSKQSTLSGSISLNLNSPKQLLEALHGIGIKVKSTDNKTLSGVKHPAAKAIQEYRSANKLLTGFINKIPSHIEGTTGRIHSSFNQYGAHSGRFTSSKPNMQQQPHNQNWRNIYRSKGGILVTADYSQIELRILAQVSGDKAFIQAFNEGVDLHSLTASKVFDKPLEEVTPQERSIAKTVNFGIAYGMWTNGLIGRLQQAGLKISKQEAEEIIKNFYKAYPQVSRYLYGISDTGLQKLKLRNAAGRLLCFNQPKDDREEGNIKRQSKNLPIQSLSADILKIAMANLHNQLEPQGVRLINSVHDELVFECTTEQADNVAATVKQEMEAAGHMYLTKVPCIAEVTISKEWSK